MSFHVAGDTHTPIDISKLNTTNWPEQRLLVKDDILTILGDCGLLWATDWDREELYWAKWLTAKKCTVCFIDGNHENFARLNAVPEVEFMGGKAGLVYSDKNGSIYHLKRGEIYTVEGRKILTVGGARSTDKAFRTPYKSWWPEEQLSPEDEENIITSLEKVNYEVDYILTHTCPTNIAKQIIGTEVDRDRTYAMMDFLQKQVSRRQWHFGHFHTSRGFEGDYICHYNWSPYKLF